MSTQGGKANLTGNVLEKFIQQRLLDEGYIMIPKNMFDTYIGGDKNVFTRQYNIGTGIYGSNLRCDLYIYNPLLYPDCLAVECKWQQSNGSVDEKFPYLVLNIKNHYHTDTIILLDGGGYKKGAERWLRAQVGDNLLKVMNMSEFTAWVNNNNL